MPKRPTRSSSSPADAGRAGHRGALAVLDHLLEGCQIIGPDWTYLYLNDAAAAQGRRGKEELLGRTMMACYPGIERTPFFELLEDSMRSRTPHDLENEFRFPDGSSGWFELRIEPVPEGVFILSLDVSERRRAAAERSKLEAQVLQAQKMEAIGRLAGGIAHDFNNLLSVVLANAEFALARLDENDPLRRDLEEIRRTTESGAALTRQLLALGRRQLLAPRVLDLNEVAGNLRSMVGRVLGEDIELVVRLAPELGNVRADPYQIEQVLMNLVVNARDAMPDGGVLTIETADVELDEAYARTHATVIPGAYVMLAVSDNGHGMDEATRSQLFEPFFTTKEAGKGSGLGLSTVYGIVRQSGGNVWVYSEPGRGTTFRVYLPRELGPAEAPPPPRAATPSRGDETVLLVEDQEPLRRLIDRILSAAGYTVLGATDGAEALALCAGRNERPHLLLTDVVLPGMGGLELAKRARELVPGLRVLFMSGYAEDAAVRQGALDPETEFIGKPFTAAELTARLRAVLDG